MGNRLFTSCCMPPREEWTAHTRAKLLALGRRANSPGFVSKYAAMRPGDINWEEATEEAEYLRDVWESSPLGATPPSDVRAEWDLGVSKRKWERVIVHPVPK